MTEEEFRFKDLRSAAVDPQPVGREAVSNTKPLTVAASVLPCAEAAQIPTIKESLTVQTGQNSAAVQP